MINSNTKPSCRHNCRGVMSRTPAADSGRTNSSVIIPPYAPVAGIEDLIFVISVHLMCTQCMVSHDVFRLWTNIYCVVKLYSLLALEWPVVWKVTKCPGDKMSETHLLHEKLFDFHLGIVIQLPESYKRAYHIQLAFENSMQPRCESWLTWYLDRHRSGICDRNCYRSCHNIGRSILLHSNSGNTACAASALQSHSLSTLQATSVMSTYTVSKNKI